MLRITDEFIRYTGIVSLAIYIPLCTHIMITYLIAMDRLVQSPVWIGTFGSRTLFSIF